MSSHTITISGYVLATLTLLVLQWRSTSPRSRIPSLGTLFSQVMRNRSARIGILAGWAWLGLHFFAR